MPSLLIPINGHFYVNLGKLLPLGSSSSTCARIELLGMDFQGPYRGLRARTHYLTRS